MAPADEKNSITDLIIHGIMKQYFLGTAKPFCIIPQPLKSMYLYFLKMGKFTHLLFFIQTRSDSY